MHVDLDMFFAAVELRKNPTLRGEPVIVGNPEARKTKKGVVLTCTYEARQFGVKSGMSMFEALHKCPNAIIVPPSRKEYSETSWRIMEYLKGYGVPIKIASIDEAYMDVTEIAETWEDARELAWKIQEDIFEREKLTCSIGIGPTLKIAKIASDYDKPKGIVIVKPEDLPDFFRGLPVSSIPGIGNVTSTRLKDMGIETCDQLIFLSLLELKEIFGSMADHIFRLFRGETTNKIKERAPRKSISHERTFHGQPGEKSRYKKIMDSLFERTYEVLIREKLETRTVIVKVRFSNYKTITRSRSLPFPSHDREKLYNITKELLETHFSSILGIRLIGIGFSNLKKKEQKQLSLVDFLQ